MASLPQNAVAVAKLNGRRGGCVAEVVTLASSACRRVTSHVDRSADSCEARCTGAAREAVAADRAGWDGGDSEPGVRQLKLTAATGTRSRHEGQWQGTGNNRGETGGDYRVNAETLKVSGPLELVYVAVDGPNRTTISCTA